MYLSSLLYTWRHCIQELRSFFALGQERTRPEPAWLSFIASRLQHFSTFLFMFHRLLFCFVLQRDFETKCGKACGKEASLLFIAECISVVASRLQSFPLSSARLLIALRSSLDASSVNNVDVSSTIVRRHANCVLRLSPIVLSAHHVFMSCL